MNIKENYKNKNELNFQDILFYKNIITDSFVKYAFDNTFCTFKSINDIIYLFYSKIKKFNNIL